MNELDSLSTLHSDAPKRTKSRYQVAPKAAPDLAPKLCEFTIRCASRDSYPHCPMTLRVVTKLTIDRWSCRGMSIRLTAKYLPGSALLSVVLYCSFLVSYMGTHSS